MPRKNVHRRVIGGSIISGLANNKPKIEVNKKKGKNINMIYPGETIWQGSLQQKVYNVLKNEYESHGESYDKNELIERANKICSDNKQKALEIAKKEFDEKNIKINKEIAKKDFKKIIEEKRKPKILLICDVRNWAWWNKSMYLKKYLSDEFDFDIINIHGKGRRGVDKKKYDIYLTYGYSFVNYLNGIPKHKRITGVTAHRPKNMIVNQMKKCGYVHANSLLLKKELEKWGLKNIFYVPNGVDTELFKPIKEIPLKRDNIIVGHIGKNSNMKGQDIIKKVIKKSGAQSFLHLNTWQNMVPYREMYKKYQDIDVFIVASIEDGTPNPALEAMACGRPVISNNIGNMPEVIINGYNGFIVKKDVNAYVEKINWLKENRDKLIEMGKNARKSIIDGGWTWENQAENYRNMFRKILNI